jgi:3-isopropylmalate dehydratase small subunit
LIEICFIDVGPATATYVDNDTEEKVTIEVDMENMCFMEFFEEWNSTVNKDGSISVVKRKKPAIINVVPFAKPDLEDPTYCYQQLMLYTPFRRHSDVLKPLDERVDEPEDETFTLSLNASVNDNCDPCELLKKVITDEKFPKKYAKRREATELLAAAFDSTRITEEDTERNIHNFMMLYGIEDYEGLNGLTLDEMEELMTGYRNEISNYNIVIDNDSGIINDHQRHLDADKFARAMINRGKQDRFATKNKKKKTENTNTENNQQQQNNNNANVTNLVINEIDHKLDELKIEETLVIEGNRFDEYQKKLLLLVLKAIKSTLLHKKSYLSHAQVVPGDTCHIIVQGAGGSGKTTVLLEVKRLIQKYLGEKSLKLFAPTATAAVLLGGTTLHRVFLKKGRSDWNEYNRLPKGGSIGQLQADFADVYAIIGDEMSMITTYDIVLIARRLADARGTGKEEDEMVCYVII